jgi:hypothetical protein
VVGKHPCGEQTAATDGGVEAKWEVRRAKWEVRRGGEKGAVRQRARYDACITNGDDGRDIVLRRCR